MGNFNISQSGRGGATVWLTGLPSSGKTAIALILARRLRAEGRRVEVLDGDVVRRFLTSGLGFSRADRNINVQRIGLVAEILARNDILAIVAAIAPFAESRSAVCRRHASNGIPYLEIYVATPVEVCSKRDVKGLYAKQAAGELEGLTGADAPYEPPTNPTLVLQTQLQTPQESADAVYALLVERQLV